MLLSAQSEDGRLSESKGFTLRRAWAEASNGDPAPKASSPSLSVTLRDLVPRHTIEGTHSGSLALSGRVYLKELSRWSTPVGVAYRVGYPSLMPWLKLLWQPSHRSRYAVTTDAVVSFKCKLPFGEARMYTRLLDKVSTYVGAKCRATEDVWVAMEATYEPLRSGITDYRVAAQYQDRLCASYSPWGGPAVALQTGKHTSLTAQLLPRATAPSLRLAATRQLPTGEGVVEVDILRRFASLRLPLLDNDKWLVSLRAKGSVDKPATGSLALEVSRKA